MQCTVNTDNRYRKNLKSVISPTIRNHCWRKSQYLPDIWYHIGWETTTNKRNISSYVIAFYNIWYLITSRIFDIILAERPQPRTSMFDHIWYGISKIHWHRLKVLEIEIILSDVRLQPRERRTVHRTKRGGPQVAPDDAIFLCSLDVEI